MGPGAYPVPQALRDLGDHPTDRARFRELWAELCAEETTYDAAYAALPHLMDLAARVDPADADEYLVVAGLIATYASEVPADLEPAYAEACGTGAHLRYLLATVAAVRGRTDLAEVLQDIDAVQAPCPTCGTVVHPSMLEAVIERDRSS